MTAWEESASGAWGVSRVGGIGLAHCRARQCGAEVVEHAAGAAADRGGQHDVAQEVGAAHDLRERFIAEESIEALVRARALLIDQLTLDQLDNLGQ